MANGNLHISEKCIQCGSCLGLNTGLVQETRDGRIQASPGTFVEIENENVRNLISICPTGAISVDLGVKKENPKSALKRVIHELQSVQPLPQLTNEMIRFDEKEYRIDLPHPRGELRYEYSSDRAAERAAENEFNQIMYSKIDAIILKIIAEYRVRKLSSYFSDKKETGSVYVQHNESICQLLEEAKKIVSDAGINCLPKDFCNFSVFPYQDELSIWKELNKGELIADELVTDIRSEFDSGSYSSLSSYRMYYRTDDMEVYVGTGFGGRIKFKDKYCYEDVREACRELAKDIQRACGYQRSAIEERAKYILNSCMIDPYNRLMELEINKKISTLQEIINRL